MNATPAVSTHQGSALEAASPQVPIRQRLKSERVQEGLAALPDEPFRIQLKSERVTIDLFASMAVITLHGNPAVDDAGTAG